jgi:hypothetical protein
MRAWTEPTDCRQSAPDFSTEKVQIAQAVQATHNANVTTSTARLRLGALRFSMMWYYGGACSLAASQFACPFAWRTKQAAGATEQNSTGRDKHEQ